MPDLTLGFDTSAAHCAAALLRDDKVLAQVHENMSRGQAERLFPMIQDLLSSNGVTWRDLAVIGVGIGPGNFTGVRVAVAAARGLALSLSIPVIGVSATDAAAYGLPRPCRVTIPARGDSVIWQDFGNGDSEPGLSNAATLPLGPPLGQSPTPIAEAVARLAWARRAEAPATRPSPIYLRPADAAPARDRGPVMLP